MFTEKDNISNETKIYTLKEVSRLLGVTQQTAIAMIKDGRLEATRGKRRAYLITEESLKRLVQEGRNKK